MILECDFDNLKYSRFRYQQMNMLISDTIHRKGDITLNLLLHKNGINSWNFVIAATNIKNNVVIWEEFSSAVYDFKTLKEAKQNSEKIIIRYLPIIEDFFETLES